MTKLCIDWPMSFTQLGERYGDITFALAQLYLDEKRFYRDTLKDLRKNGKEIMLDNGAWEFGKTMDPKRYLKVIKDLQPTYAVIPDVFREREATFQAATEFFKGFSKLEVKPKLILAPQGKNVKEIVQSYDELGEAFGSYVDIVGIPKHIGKIMNRVAFTEHLWQKGKLKFTDVHFLGYWDWDEIVFGREDRVNGRYNWRMHSIDTKYPVKWAFNFEFQDQIEYYKCEMNLPVSRLIVGVDAFKRNLENCMWF